MKPCLRSFTPQTILTDRRANAHRSRRGPADSRGNQMNEGQVRVWLPRCEQRHSLSLPGKARWNVCLRAEVSLADLSLKGCQIRLAAEPLPVGTVFFIRPDGLGTLRSIVRWHSAYGMGLAFDDPLHPAVFEHLVTIADWTHRSQRSRSLSGRIGAR
jgi:hypothetical protein